MLRSAVLIVALSSALFFVPNAFGGEPTGSTARPAAEAAVTAQSGDDWPCFLGPLGTGVTGDRGLADRWPETGPPIVWAKRIGSGYSAPSVRGGKLVLHHHKVEDVVQCVHAETGEPIWKFEYLCIASDGIEVGNGPRCTPLLTADRCYTYGADGKLLCLDMQTGKPVWSRNTLADFPGPGGFFGVGCTPILEDDRLIVLVGGQPNSGVVAFRADTGQTVWQSVGKDTWDGAPTTWRQEPVYRWTGNEQIVSYSSPIAVTIHGKRHILCLMRHGLVSVDPRDGHVNFKYWFSTRKIDSVLAARPVVIDDKIFLTASYGVGSVLLQVEPSGQAVKLLWKGTMQAHWSTPIHLDGFIYGFSGRNEESGSLQCVDLKTGKTKWSTTGYDETLDRLAHDSQTGEIKDRATRKVVPFPRFGRGSLTLAGRRLLVLGERGTLALAEMSPAGYHELARASFKGIGFPIWPSPVLAGTRLYLRDESTLMCIDLGRKP